MPDLEKLMQALFPQPAPPKRYKLIDGGYIISVGTAPPGEEITVEEYDGLLALIADKPTPPEGYGYRLRTDLTWEPYERPPMPEEEELDPAEALKLICGSSSLTRQQAAAYRTELVKSGAVADKPVIARGE